MNLMRPKLLADIHISPLTQSGLNNPSIVSLRVSDAKPHRISIILKTVLPQIEPDLQEGAIVSIEETEYRVRKLPIS
jgi:predicted nuclease of predicted toxin-antitoxin system